VTPNRFAVRGIPTLILFKGGQPVATKMGADSKGNLTAWVDANL
jgi:thioredoxin 1